VAHLGDATFFDTEVRSFMPDKVDIQYAMEHTHVLREPDRRIDTFGSSRFHFIILSEMMDEVGEVIVRRGTVEAYKPQIIKPKHYSSVELEGFDDKARDFLDWLKENNIDVDIDIKPKGNQLIVMPMWVTHRVSPIKTKTENFSATHILEFIFSFLKFV
jgi:hypothetical protein